MDYETLSGELIRALRGKRSQIALSRRLGHKSNVLHAWERGHNAPTARQVFTLLERTNRDSRAIVGGFFRVPPAWLATANLCEPDGVTALLLHLRGALTVSELSRASGLSRFALARLFTGSAQPKLPQMLALVDVCTRRLPDFIAQFVDPLQLPSLRTVWRQQQARRETASRAPWSAAVLAALELADYRGSGKRERGWLAQRLGLSMEQEREALALLEASGQIRLRKGSYQPTGAEAVELNEDRRLAKARREFWSQVAAERVRRGQGMSAYNVCGISKADLVKLKAMQRQYLASARELIAKSAPVQTVALIQVNVLDLTVWNEPPPPTANTD